MRTRTGDELKQLRNQAGLSQARAAKLARTPKRTWEQWEQRPETTSYCRPPGWAFSFLEMYILLRKLGGEYEPED